jgi:hypothetical protein
MTRKDVWYLVRRRAADAGIKTRIRCHTFRATGITARRAPTARRRTGSSGIDQLRGPILSSKLAATLSRSNVPG